jgi:GAF domain-containing protein/FixJ family two-component response regulator
MDNIHVLVVTDDTETSEHLAHELLPGAGYSVTLADDFTPPPTCDAILVDVTRLRSSPFARLKAQRRMGCQAAALLCAPRLTEQMAVEMFSLGVREFVLSPVEDATLLEKLTGFVSRVHREQSQDELRALLNETQTALARQLEEMNTLSRIGRSITSLTNMDTVLSYIVEAAVFLTGADEGAIFLLDEESDELLLRAEQGLGSERAEAFSRPSADSDAVTVARTGQPVMRGGDAEHKIKTGHMVRALINVPIIVEQRTMGVLAVYNHGDRSFESADQTILAGLADYAAIALDKIRSLEYFAARVEAALDTSQTVLLHAETMHDPVEGIESLVDTLLADGFGTLTEKQSSAVSRVKLATVRLREIFELIRQTIAEFEEGDSSR